MKTLTGIRVVEFDAIGPVPFAAMMLADHGAHVTRILRPGGHGIEVEAGDDDVLLRGRAERRAIDLKTDAGRDEALALMAQADVVLEGHRPGVMERLGLGPDVAHARNPALVYGRVTGYGQDGPMAKWPGHDLNYISQVGALHPIGDPDLPPPPPLTHAGDFGGGGMLGAFGVLAALLHARATGEGAVIDIAMVDGAALLMSLYAGMRKVGLWSDTRGANLLDGAAPFYRCYRTKEGEHIAIGAIEPQFYAALRKALTLDDPLFDAQMDSAKWPEMCAVIAARIGAMTLADLEPLLSTPDACATRVLPLGAVAQSPQVAARQTFRDGAPQPAPRIAPAK